MHQSMPGSADLFEDDKLFNRSVAMPIAMKFSSAQAINKVGADGMAKFLKQQKIRFQTPTPERMAAWAMSAADPSDLAVIITKQSKQLTAIRTMLTELIALTERKIVEFLVKTP